MIQCSVISIKLLNSHFDKLKSLAKNATKLIMKLIAA